MTFPLGVLGTVVGAFTGAVSLTAVVCVLLEVSEKADEFWGFFPFITAPCGAAIAAGIALAFALDSVGYYRASAGSIAVTSALAVILFCLFFLRPPVTAQTALIIAPTLLAAMLPLSLGLRLLIRRW
jgi:hypothetical protein